MEHRAGPDESAGFGHFHGIDDQLRGHALGHGPAHDHARVQVDDGCEIEPALAGAQVVDNADQFDSRGMGPEVPAPTLVEQVVLDMPGPRLRIPGRGRLERRHPLGADTELTVSDSTVALATSWPWSLRSSSTCWPAPGTPLESMNAESTRSFRLARKAADGVGQPPLERGPGHSKNDPMS